MRQLVVLLIALLLFSALPAASSSPRIPTTMGYCVTVEGVTGITFVPLHKPDANKMDELKASIGNAVKLIALTQGREDIIEASMSIDIVDNPLPPLHEKPREPRLKPSQDAVRRKPDCKTVCWCSKVYYGTGTSVGIEQSGVGGCSGPCESCFVCRVTC